jgi:hypothetical protein
MHDAIIKLVNFAKEHLDEKQFGEFIYQLYTRGIENVFISEVPVYKNVEYHGHVLIKYIERTDYMIGVIDRAEDYVEPCDKKWEHEIEI